MNPTKRFQTPFTVKMEKGEHMLLKSKPTTADKPFVCDVCNMGECYEEIILVITKVTCTKCM